MEGTSQRPNVYSMNGANSYNWKAARIQHPTIQVFIFFFNFKQPNTVMGGIVFSLSTSSQNWLNKEGRQERYLNNFRYRQLGLFT